MRLILAGGCVICDFSPLSGHRSPLPHLAVLNSLARWQGNGEPQLGPALDMVSQFAHARGALRGKFACACWSLILNTYQLHSRFCMCAACARAGVRSCGGLRAWVCNTSPCSRTTPPAAICGTPRTQNRRWGSALITARLPAARGLSLLRFAATWRAALLVNSRVNRCLLRADRSWPPRLHALTLCTCACAEKLQQGMLYMIR